MNLPIPVIVAGWLLATVAHAALRCVASVLSLVGRLVGVGVPSRGGES